MAPVLWHGLIKRSESINVQKYSTIFFAILYQFELNYQSAFLKKMTTMSVFGNILTQFYDALFLWKWPPKLLQHPLFLLQGVLTPSILSYI